MSLVGQLACCSPARVPPHQHVAVEGIGVRVALKVGMKCPSALRSSTREKACHHVVAAVTCLCIAMRLQPLAQRRQCGVEQDEVAVPTIRRPARSSLSALVQIAHKAKGLLCKAPRLGGAIGARTAGRR